MTRAGGAELGQGELGPAEKKDLERGLMGMSSNNQGEGIECVPVWLDDKVHYSASSAHASPLAIPRSLARILPRLDFYEGMCKTFLWPIFHYLALPDDLDKQSEAQSWNAYYETNLVYAKKVAEVYKPGDLVSAASVTASCAS